ncbi:hypothetical protein IVB45_14120 [Bradyrhizobium sp. 4]|uniref:hypothetical protein n=1 Tax=unclassified Bradyrhizobium TaxID=2631580 RepID=UPI001FF77DD9|nr:MULTISPECIES: hypothetical protein [unclassified Bradyrhizobium]MCK1401439.1 hypothetical protein [Bradyrhizobium sp. 39]MCK1750593.1 hypothetical protein [Bradyrhizobium sp. 135]UPJ37885.1 hypothetical protein IVB45_14120 [Bradyrhizobium sp. 4]
MFLFRRRDVNSARFRALRELYRSFTEQNGPEARSRRLLRDWLSPEQRAQFDADNYFEVTGSHTGRRYRVQYGTLSNVVELDVTGKPAIGWCFVPDRALAAGDVMLAQKIALETDEAAVLALAHRFSPRLPSLPQVVRRAY